MSKVNHYKSTFNSQKEKLNLLAEMLEISKSLLPRISPSTLSLQELLSELIKKKKNQFNLLKLSFKICDEVDLIVFISSVAWETNFSICSGKKFKNSCQQTFHKFSLQIFWIWNLIVTVLIQMSIFGRPSCQFALHQAQLFQKNHGLLTKFYTI